MVIAVVLRDHFHGGKGLFFIDWNVFMKNIEREFIFLMDLRSFI